jgi:cytochrome b involved in lipid metabolism
MKMYKSKKVVLYIVIIIIILILGGWYYYNYKKYAPDLTKVNVMTPYTIEDIATHNNATNCYTVINNSVYDLTMWVNIHPGGKRVILSICGIDGTEKFMAKHHGGEKFMNILSRYKIGILK